ncbi:MAG: hypothetical protein B7Y35_02035 [Sphingomonadales bacterium 28-64-96]|nr:MAG: hypothetical protein B7Y35_02035 [Sphingomonadales bacterium 28-64-96]
MAFDGAGDAAGHAAAAIVGEQPLGIGLVGDIASFEQHRRDVGRLQDGKSGEMVEFTTKAHFLFLKPVLQCVGELHGDIVGGAPGEIDHDFPHFRRFDAQIDAADDVRLVFAGREALGDGIAGHGRQGINRSAARLIVGCAVGMDGDEQIGAGITRDAHPAAQRDKAVLIAGQLHPYPATFPQDPGRLAGNGQCNVFLITARHRNGADILAAMAGIDDHQRLAAGSRLDAAAGGRRFGGWPGCRRRWFGRR